MKTAQETNGSAAWIKLLILLLLVCAIFLIRVAVGSVNLPIGQVLTNTFRPSDDRVSSILWDIRFPRACSCVVVGAIIGMAGSAFQALFRNPLAEPYLVGVSSGASIGGALALVTGLGASWQGLAQDLAPMLVGLPFGLAALALVFGLARRRGIIEMHTLLLAGVVVGAMLSALLSFVLLAGGQDTNRILAWLLGSMTPAFWNRIALMAIMLVAGATILFCNSRQLNALALGEHTAQRLGVDVGRIKPVILVTGTAMVSLTVGAVGIIGFLGLVTPHIARRVVGIDWRWSLLASGLTGAALLLISDLAAQRLLGSEIPVGIVTAIIGAPFLLVLLRTRG